MEKTNFTNARLLMWVFLAVAGLLSSNTAMAQSMTCNNNVQVSVDPTANGLCEVELTADMILEGDPIPGVNYLLEVMNGVNVLYTGTNVVSFNGSSHLGDNLTVRVTNLTNNNKCWGSITVEDKAAPVVLCSNVTIPCTQDYLNLPFPDADDNCDLNPTVQLIDNFVFDPDPCTGNIVQVSRIFIAVDDSGNESVPCQQIVTITRPDDVDFPNDITWECDQYEDYSNITAASALHPTVKALESGTNVIDATGIDAANVLANTGSGIPSNIIGTYCNYAYSHSDQIINTCGNTFKIVRTWTVLDWCTGQIVTFNNQEEDNVQIIKVVDQTGPTVVRPPFNVSANIPGVHPQPCRSQGFLPPATVTDNCNTWVVRIYTPIGEAVYVNGQNGNNGGFIPAPGLTLGSYQILYQVEDICGNISELFVPVNVIDDIVPTAICDEITDVNLSSDGLAVVYASTFDDGSYDNCCLDEFLVRRMDGDCDGNFDDFGPTVTFCCSDVDEPVMVVFRAVDCFGNFNDCMVEVNVNDKLPPIVTFCPQNASIDCDTYLDEYAAAVSQGDYSVLDVFGSPSFYDNCELNIDTLVTLNINSCTEGTITRTWTATDGSPNGSATCTQVISIFHVSDWVVEFPADVTVACTDGQLPDTGEPEIFFDECELIGTSHEDQIFYIVPDACYKIERTWTVINWCVYDDFGYNAYSEAGRAEINLNVDWDGDGDKDNRTFRDGWNSTGTPGTPDGYITWKQIIKVIDEEAPEFTIPAIDGCITDTDCDTDITLPFPDINDDCSPTFDVDITGDFGDFDNITGDVTIEDVVPGEYEVTYAVTDNCGNTSYQTITVVVEDCKKPTPYCVSGLVVEIMQTGMVELWASDFDAGSFDNCGPVQVSFSPDVNDVNVIFTCDDIGLIQIELWVTDAAGNQDFCITNLILQDNMNICGTGTPLVSVAGSISDEEETAVEGVNVELSGNGMVSATTDASGSYLFANVPMGGDYTVTPILDNNHGNGVTTWDIVLITRHILQIQLLDSPYKIIAADANKTNSVTTTDLVDIRKVILQLVDEFPSNSSWRFVDETHVFSDMQNPFLGGFPEVVSFNNLNADQLFADFVGVKVGDVNNSAATAAGDAEERSFAGTLTLNANDMNVEAGKEYSVEFTAADLAVLGFQFTLNFDQDVLELVDLVEGVATEENFGMAKLNEGAITASWNGEAAADAVLFTLVFQANADANLSELLSINSRFTAAEAYNQNGELMDVTLQFNNGKVAGGFELYQNVPNPFSGETVIGFNLPEAGAASLKVSDMSGKVLMFVRGDFAKGYNQFTVRANELPASGVLFYTIETANDTATKKMVIVK